MANWPLVIWQSIFSASSSALSLQLSMLSPTNAPYTPGSQVLLCLCALAHTELCQECFSRSSAWQTLGPSLVANSFNLLVQSQLLCPPSWLRHGAGMTRAHVHAPRTLGAPEDRLQVLRSFSGS